MRAVLGFVGLLAVLAAGYYIFMAQVAPVESGGPPLQQMNLVAVKTDLLSLARCEQIFLATNGSYGSIEQLRQAGNLNPFPGANHRGYLYEIEIDGGSHFRITAKPVDPTGTELPTLTIDERMKIF